MVFPGQHVSPDVLVLQRPVLQPHTPGPVKLLHVRLVLQLLGLLVPQQTAPVVPLPILMHWPPQQVSFAVLLQHVPPHSGLVQHVLLSEVKRSFGQQAVSVFAALVK